MTPDNVITDKKTGKRRCKICREAYKASYVSEVTCSAEDCDEPQRAKGLCSKHYQRMVNKGSLDDPVYLTPEEVDQHNREKGRRHYRNNHEHVRAQKRARYEVYRESENERSRRYNAANRERIAENNRRWREANPERRAELAREWVAANPLRARELWQAKHVRRKRQMRETAVGPVSFERIIDRDGMTCHICGEPIETLDDLHFDHVIPLARGGPHVEENIRPAHAKCNLRKSDKLLA